MRTLCFAVHGQALTTVPSCDYSGIIVGTANYLKAKFTFDGDWSGCKKVAVFYWTPGDQYVVPLVDNECFIPAEALTMPIFYVHLVGAKGDYRITTNRLTISQSEV